MVLFVLFLLLQHTLALRIKSLESNSGKTILSRYVVNETKAALNTTRYLSTSTPPPTATLPTLKTGVLIDASVPIDEAFKNRKDYKIIVNRSIHVDGGRKMRIEFLFHHRPNLTGIMNNTGDISEIGNGVIDETKDIHTGFVDWPEDKKYNFWYHPDEGIIYWDADKGDLTWESKPLDLTEVAPNAITEVGTSGITEPVAEGTCKSAKGINQATFAKAEIELSDLSSGQSVQYEFKIYGRDGSKAYQKIGIMICEAKGKCQEGDGRYVYALYTRGGKSDTFVANGKSVYATVFPDESDKASAYGGNWSLKLCRGTPPPTATLPTLKTVATSWDVKNCHASTETAGNVLQLDASDSKWPGDLFCYAIPKEKTVTSYGNYEMSVDFRNINSQSSANSGQVGLMFNMVDDKNFDFVYFRIQSSDHFQTGYVEDNILTINDNQKYSGVFYGKHNIKILVSKAKDTQVLIDGEPMGTFAAHYNTKNSGGVITCNGYSEVVNFVNFKLIIPSN